jgi:CRISPR-associated protein Csm4
MQAIILKLRPGSQFHFGRVAVDDDTALADCADWLHSDTLFSALTQVIADAFPAYTQQFVDAVAQGQIILSSAFYCLYNQGQYCYFLPVPANWLTEVNDRSNMPAQLRFLSKTAWEYGVTAKLLAYTNEAMPYAVLQQQFLVHRSELGSADYLAAARFIKVYEKATLPKVTVHKDPTQDEGGLFARTVLQVGDNRHIRDRHGRLLTPDLGVHFYCLEQLHAELAADLLQCYRSAWQLLVHTGVGGERSTGCGMLDSIEYQPFSLQLKKAGTRFCNLSLLSPAAADWAHLQAYHTTLRGGRRTVEGPTQRYLRMVAEGALADAPLLGSLQQLGQHPDGHPYWRNGRGCTIPCTY